MSSLPDRLTELLGEVLSVEQEPDDALTLRHNGTIASVRVVNIAPDLDLISLTQILAWDLPLTKKLGEQVAKQARELNFGSVSLLQKSSTASKSGGKTGDVMLRYNFPGAGLSDDALRTLVLLVLDTGAQIRSAVTA